MNILKTFSISCPHFDQCSGCRTDKDAAHVLDQVLPFFAKHGFPSIPLQAGASTGWRCRAKLAVRGTVSDPQIGLFEEGTHRVVKIPHCQVHHPAINASVDTIVDWIRLCNIAPYDETLQCGSLRYLQLTVEKETGKVQLVLVLNRSEFLDKSLEASFKRLWEMGKENFHSLWVNFNTRKDNIIFSDEWKLVFGDPLIHVSYCGKSLYYHPASFFQANPAMYERLLKSLQLAVPDGASVVEFYAGVGAMALSLAEQAKSVTCTEITPLAKMCFDAAVKQLPESLQEKFSYQVGSVKTHLNLLTEDVDTVIVDPPRKGLDRALLKALNQSATLKTLIYVSCGWPSFVKDFNELIAANWQLTKVEAFLFFPGTDHLEILAVFSRGEGQ